MKIPVVNHVFLYFFHIGETLKMNIYLEIFGYIGTALVIVSMLMTSIVKLRIINMCGGLISLIYAICVNTWPVVVLNACLISINFVQTVRQLRGKEDVTILSLKAGDPTANHLLGIWQKDIQKYYPDLDFEEINGKEVHILYVEEEAVGFLVGARNGELFSLSILYLIPSHRTVATGERIFAALREKGVHILTSCEFYTKAPHRYLCRMGFEVRDGLLVKQI
ncbi:MAG: YgjV family protein [Clostridia bacterium]|nr:YgjV family protein [Clostridia bacterium]